MDISIIIVNYNTPALTLACVESIYKSGFKGSFEIVIVDNDSTDSGKESILVRCPRVIWVQNTYNAGFARGNNLGLKSARGEVILFLNSDTIVTDNAIAECYKRMRSNQHIVAASVQLLNVDESLQDSSYDSYYWLDLINGIPYLNKVLHFPIRLLKNLCMRVKGIEIGYLNGAFLMVKMEIISKSGFFDEDFFLYSEDAELCLRLKSYGDLFVYRDLFVYHLIHGSKSNDNFHYGQQQLSIQLFVRKQFGVIAYLFYICLVGFSVPLMLFVSSLKAILKLDFKFCKNFGSYFSMFYLWVCFAPKIISRTPFLYKFKFY